MQAAVGLSKEQVIRQYHVSLCKDKIVSSLIAATKFFTDQLTKCNKHLLEDEQIGGNRVTSR